MEKSLLKYYIKSLIKENYKNFLIEASVSVDNLPQDVYFEFEKGSLTSGFEIKIYQGDQIIGFIDVNGPGNAGGPCLNAHTIALVRATKGYGPLLYDLALEIAGQSGIAPDRSSVSASASKVWSYYYNNRNDIEKKQLDDVDNPQTPEPNDDCKIESSKDSEGNIIMPWLNFVYYKQNQDILNKLRSLNKIKE